MTITYHIGVDSDDDGNFTEIGDALAAEVLHAEWRIGMANPYDTVAAVGQAIITVRNQTGTFSPERSQNLIGKTLQIQSDDGTTLRTQFTGMVHQIIPQAGEFGTREAQIIAYDRIYDLQRQTIRLPLLVDVRADDVITAIINQLTWRYPSFGGFCIIDCDSIGSSTIFPDEEFTSLLDVGKSQFAYVADDWGDGLDASLAIQRLTDAESGRFFFDRTGQAIFHNRHYHLLNTALDATFSDDMTALDYRYGDVTNAVEVTLVPRSIGLPQTVIWSTQAPIKIGARQTIDLVVRFAINDEPVGAIDLMLPLLPADDYKAYLLDEETDLFLTEVSEDVTILVKDSSVSAITLAITNRLYVDAYLTELTLRGTPLLQEDPITVTAQDDVSITLYGKRIMQVYSSVLSDPEDAIGILQWELRRRSEPRGIVETLHTNTRNHPSETLALTIHDLIRITETQTGHDSTYAIIGEHHTVDRGGTRHQVAWLLEPTLTDYFFVVNTHSIDDLTRFIVAR